MKKKVVVVGLGYWGLNILRTCTTISNCEVVAVVDRNEEKRAHAHNISPDVKLFDQVSEIGKINGIDLVFICTQASSQFEILKQVADFRLNAFVEKPFCCSLAEAMEISELFEKSGIGLKIGHTYLYSSNYQNFKNKVIGLINFGEEFSYTSCRFNNGKFPADVGIFSNLMYHDLYILDDIFGLENLDIDSKKEIKTATNQSMEGLANLNLKGKNAKISIHCKQQNFEKVRRIEVAQISNKIVWDDLTENHNVRTPLEEQISSAFLETGKNAYVRESLRVKKMIQSLEA